jgi:lipopolysaccharide biosynthesis glycosyltransferase
LAPAAQEDAVTLHVACATDSAYAPHCATMLHSLLAHHAPGAVHTHVLRDASLDAASSQHLATMVAALGGSVTFHTIDPATCAGLPTMERIPTLMWYRVLLPELLPELDRILYVDCDTLTRADLAPLWQTNLADHYIAAADNVLERDFADRAERLGLPPGQRYFNSGVLLMNLDRMRREQCSTALLDYGRSRGDSLVWPDQDALNVVLGARRAPLHPRWNCQNTLFYFPDRSSAVFGADVVRDAVLAPAIVHFEGPALAKPWHYLCKHPLRAEYWQHRAATPWPTAELEGRTWPNRILRLVPMKLLPHAYGAARRLKHAALQRTR